MKERFEDILKQKLHEAEAPPPDGMWDRLSRSMAEIRREETFAKAAETAQTAAPTIRRPRKRRLSWGYAAASIAAIAVVFTISRNISIAPGEGNPIAGKTEGTSVSPESGIKDTTNGAADPVYAQADEREAVGQPGNSPATDRVRSYALAANTPEPKNNAAGDRNDYGTEGVAPVYGNTVVGDTPATDNRNAIGTDTGTDKTVSTPGMAEGSERQPSEGSRVLTQQEMNDILYADSRSGKGRTRSSVSDRKTGIGLFAGNAPSGKNSMGEQPSHVLSLSADQSLSEYGYSMRDFLQEAGDKAEMKHDYPISAGISVSIPLTDKLDLQTGVTYTYMKSDAHKSGENVRSYDVEQKLHYIGIPVSVKYDFLEAGNFVLYGNAGGTVEKCISGKKKISASRDNDESVSESFTVRGKGVQTSVGANVGAEYKITDMLGIYVEPGVSYYFENSNQPRSYRTEHPWNFTAKAGIRINL